MVADLVDRIAGQPLGELAALLLQQQVHQALRPRFPSCGSHRTSTWMKSAAFALPHQRLRPVTTHSSPSSTARVETPARSEPASGSGQRDRADPLAAGAAAEQLVAAVPSSGRRPQALRAGQDAGRRHPGPGQLLADHAVLEDAEAQPARVGRHGDAEVAELGQPLQQATPGSRPSAGRARSRPAAPRPSRTGGPAPAAPPLGRVPRGQQVRRLRLPGLVVGRRHRRGVSPRRAVMITYTLGAGVPAARRHP